MSNDQIDKEVDFLLAKFVIPSVADRYDAVLAVSAWAHKREAELQEYKDTHEGVIKKHGTDACPYCAQEAELAALREENIRLKSAHVDCFWHDCKTTGPRGADHCKFEGTHVCTLCTVADLKAERDAAHVAGMWEAMKIAGSYAGVFCGESTGGVEQKACELVHKAIAAAIAAKETT